MGKTSMTEQEQKIDDDLRRESEQLYGLGHMISALGYNPYEGLNVAARSPKELAADNATNVAATAFGMPTAEASPLPTPTNQGGLLGYSTQKMAEQQPGYAELERQINEIFARGGNQPELTGPANIGGGGKK